MSIDPGVDVGLFYVFSGVCNRAIGGNSGYPLLHYRFIISKGASPGRNVTIAPYFPFRLFA